MIENMVSQNPILLQQIDETLELPEELFWYDDY